MKHPHQELTRKIIGACFEVMNELGTGFLEVVYRRALVIALRQLGLKVDEEVPMKVYFRGHEVGSYVADILVDDVALVETKVAQAIANEHLAQAINYLKGTNREVGVVANFGKPTVQHRTVTHGRLRQAMEQDN